MKASILVSLVAIGILSSVKAATITSNVTGGWNQTSTWNTSQVPETSDNVYIANNTTVTLDDGLSYTVATLRVSTQATAAALAHGDLEILNGTLTSQGQTFVGNRNGYNGTMIVGGAETSATFNGTSLYVAYNTGSNGTVEIASNGTINLSSSEMRIGSNDSATGYLKVTGGTLNASSAGINIATAESATGYLNMTDGIIKANILRVGNSANSKAYANLSGGELTTTKEVYVGAADNSNGTLTISGGTHIGGISTHIAYGQNSTAYLKMDGGNFTTTTTTTIASGENSTATLEITAGNYTTATATNIATGVNSNATLKITGGNFTTATTGNLANADGSKATLIIAGGNMIYTGQSDLYIGGRIAGSNEANFTMSSGSLNLNNKQLIIGSTNAGTQNVIGESLITGGEIKNLTGIIVGGNSGPTTSYGKLRVGVNSGLTIRGSANLNVRSSGELHFILEGSDVIGLDNDYTAMAFSAYTSTSGASIILDASNLTWVGNLNEELTITLITMVSAITNANKNNTSLLNIGFDNSPYELTYFNWSDDGKSLYATITYVIPEPATYALIATLGAISLVLYRRRKQ